MKSHQDFFSVWLSPKKLSRSDWRKYTLEEQTPFRFPKSSHVLKFADSQFGSDFSLVYDDSFFDVRFKPQPVTLRTLLKGLPGCDEAIEEIEVAASKKRITKSNAAIVIPSFAFDRDGNNYQAFASRINQSYNRRAALRFVGSFQRKFAADKSQDPLKGKTRIVLVKHNDLSGQITLCCMERKGVNVTTYSGIYGRKLKKKTKSASSVTDAKELMAKTINDKQEQGYEVESGWKKWVELL